MHARDYENMFSDFPMSFEMGAVAHLQIDKKEGNFNL